MPSSNARATLMAGLIGLWLAVTLVFGCSDHTDNDLEKPAAHILGEWLGVPADSFRLAESERVTWPNGCMGVEWPGRVCTQATVAGYRLTLRSPNGQPHYVHASDAGDYVWAPIWETESTIRSLNGLSVSFDPARGGFSQIGRIVPGTTIVGTPRAGARVYAAQSSAVRDKEDAPLVLLVILDP